ncbi:MAG: hypothetical protein F6K09_32360, partial [Merismopedia sp. SIO2A8]|nr:hypothetical protein [Merismopedia sp. SIO2A8]
RKELAVLRNEAEGLLRNYADTMRDNVDQIPDELKSQAGEAFAALREAKDDSTIAPEEMKSLMEALQNRLLDIGRIIYGQLSGSGGGRASGGSAQPSGGDVDDLSDLLAEDGMTGEFDNDATITADYEAVED